MSVALVTGGTRGIGFGAAEALAREGWNLVVCGVRSEAEAADSLSVLRAHGTEVRYVQADIGDSEARLRLVETAVSWFGRIDALVNNAGVAPKERKDILDATEESFDRLISINLKGPYFLTQLVANGMIAAKKADETFQGRIVFVTSISATTASPNRGEYCVSKAGLAMTSSLWAVRLAEFGIPVYEVRPGIIKTDMTAGVTQKYDTLIEDGLLLQKRWGTPEDVGKAVAMLLRGDLPYSTGQVIMVDGGFSVERL